MSVQTRFRWCTSTACFLPLVSAENIYSRAQSAGGGEAQSQHLGRMPKSSRSNLYCRMNGGNIALKCGKTAKNEWKESNIYNSHSAFRLRILSLRRGLSIIRQNEMVVKKILIVR